MLRKPQISNELKQTLVNERFHISNIVQWNCQKAAKIWYFGPNYGEDPRNFYRSL